MIFVTVGTEKFPFDRLIKAFEEAVRKNDLQQEIFAQIGRSLFKPRSYPYKDFIEFHEMLRFIKTSDIVVSHAGVGSTLLCLSLGKVPIIFPRNVKFGEHVDNHQVEFAMKFEVLRKVLVAYDEMDLICKIENYKGLVEELKASSTTSNRDKLIGYIKGVGMENG